LKKIEEKKIEGVIKKNRNRAHSLGSKKTVINETKEKKDDDANNLENEKMNINNQFFNAIFNIVYIFKRNIY
jgi:hypothetical protein